MKIFKLGIFLSCITLLSIIVSCANDNEEEMQEQMENNNGNEGNENEEEENTQLTYTNDIKPIIDSKCATSACHGGRRQPTLTTFTQVNNNLNSIKTEAIDQKTMPPAGPLTSNEITLLSSWIEQGAKE